MAIKMQHKPSLQFETTPGYCYPPAAAIVIFAGLPANTIPAYSNTNFEIFVQNCEPIREIEIAA